MARQDPLLGLVREIILAVGMIAIIILALWAHTGSMPPLVVVESSSMIHDKSGEVGSIDAGDLILVHKREWSDVITFAEATDTSNPNFGHESHGLAGDVIIYERNGEEGTPIIHRAILRAIPNRTAVVVNNSCEEGVHDQSVGICILSWDVPGTEIRDAENISISFDGISAGRYDCGVEAHGNMILNVVEWRPEHSGFLTLGDNNHCSVDQGSKAVPGSSGVYSASGVVGPVKADWLIGVAGGEIPWLGVVKLMVSGDDSPGIIHVPNSSFFWLAGLIVALLLAPIILEPIGKRMIATSPELIEAQREDALDAVVSLLGEEEE
jgi:signal peptidase I